MSINISFENSQANKISDYISNLREMRNKLNEIKNNLNNAWRAEEMLYINNNIESIETEISRLWSTLDSLSADIITTALEIKREEEAKAAARAVLSKK